MCLCTGIVCKKCQMAAQWPCEKWTRLSECEMLSSCEFPTASKKSFCSFIIKESFTLRYSQFTDSEEHEIQIFPNTVTGTSTMYRRTGMFISAERLQSWNVIYMKCVQRCIYIYYWRSCKNSSKCSISSVECWTRLSEAVSNHTCVILLSIFCLCSKWSNWDRTGLWWRWDWSVHRCQCSILAVTVLF